MAINRGSVVIYRNFMDAISGVPERSYKRIMNAVLHYAMDGVEPKLDGLELAVFCMAKTQIDANNQKYENGSKGGRPRNQVAESENQNETKEEPNGNQTETENNQSETETEPTRARMRNVKCKMINDIVSKKESKKEEIDIKEQTTRETYDEILDEFGVQGDYREAIFRFIAHLKANHKAVMLNSRLERLIVALDKTYSTDYDKVRAIDNAIIRGYEWLEVEC